MIEHGLFYMLWGLNTFGRIQCFLHVCCYTYMMQAMENVETFYMTCIGNWFTFWCWNRSIPWWRHQMETFSALLAICAWNSPVPGEFPAQGPVTRSFDIFFDLRLNKRLSKQSWGWWFETPSCSLWRHCQQTYYCPCKMKCSLSFAWNIIFVHYSCLNWPHCNYTVLYFSVFFKLIQYGNGWPTEKWYLGMYCCVPQYLPLPSAPWHVSFTLTYVGTTDLW